MHTNGKNQDYYCEPYENKISTDSEKKCETLSEWYINQSKNIQYIKLLHRLDFETHGIVLFAKNEKCFNFLKKAQDENEFIKEYSAICHFTMHTASQTTLNTPHSSLHTSNSALQGFPKPLDFLIESISPEKPFIIESYFRPFGPGRKLVRPVIDDGKKHKETAKDKGGFYKTEIININKNIITARIKCGFRHQIRCHLCWIGIPIKNDPLYSADLEAALSPDEFSKNALPADSFMLRAHAVNFPDPSSSKNAKKLEFCISPLQ